MPKDKKDKKENIYYDDTDIELVDTRPSYAKKRVIIPAIMAVMFLAAGIYFIIHSLHYQETDDAFVEGHIISIAPRVSGPVLKLLVDDNEEVKKGQLLLEIDPNDYITALKQKEAALEEAKASLNMAEREITHSNSELKRSSEDITAAKSRLKFATEDYKRYNYLSINSVTKYQAIFEHLKNDPKIKSVLMRVDHDKAGIKLNKKVCSELKEQFPHIRISVEYPPKEKDWNDYLVYQINQREKVDAYTIIF